jgi:hypothetical protein
MLPILGSRRAACTGGTADALACEAGVAGLVGRGGAPISRRTPGRSGIAPDSTMRMKMSVFNRCSSATKALRSAGSVIERNGSSSPCSCAERARQLSSQSLLVMEPAG